MNLREKFHAIREAWTTRTRPEEQKSSPPSMAERFASIGYSLAERTGAFTNESLGITTDEEKSFLAQRISVNLFNALWPPLPNEPAVNITWDNAFNDFAEARAYARRCHRVDNCFSEQDTKFQHCVKRALDHAAKEIVPLIIKDIREPGLFLRFADDVYWRFAVSASPTQPKADLVSLYKPEENTQVELNDIFRKYKKDIVYFKSETPEQQLSIPVAQPA